MRRIGEEIETDRRVEMEEKKKASNKKLAVFLYEDS